MTPRHAQLEDLQAVSLEEFDALERRLEAAEDALWECVKLSGEDTSDGRPRPGTRDWPQLPELAVRAVKQLREDYDSV